MFSEGPLPKNPFNKSPNMILSNCVFFHEHSQIKGEKEKGGGGVNFFNRLYHFHPLQRHLETRQVINADSSPLHIANDGT